MPKIESKRPSQVLAQQVKTVREHRGLTQHELALKLCELGFITDRATVAKIETSKRGVSLDEAVTLAAALNVAPVHLFTPRSPDDHVAVGPAAVFRAGDVRRWCYGQAPLATRPKQPDRDYFMEAPDEEFDVRNSPAARAGYLLSGLLDAWARGVRGDLEDKISRALSQVAAEVDAMKGQP